MNQSTTQCLFCGQFFVPDPRVGEKQKSCFREACRKKRKQASHKQWVATNQGYFKGRYSNTKTWREKNPGYQSAWRARKRREIQDECLPQSPIKSIRLVVPATFFQGEIQDEIRLVRQCGCGFWMAGGGMQDTRHDGLKTRPVVRSPA